MHFTSITSKDGLSSNTVHAILKDRYGLMWFATEDGLNKFNGTDFTVYTHSKNDSTSLQSNEVVCLHEDRAGRLWVGTIGGSLNLYDRVKDSFIHFKSDSSTGVLSASNIKALCSDYTGKLWIGTLGGVNVLDPVSRKLTGFTNNPAVPIAIKSGIVLSVFEDSQKRMWIGTSAGLYLYERKYNRFQAFLHGEKDPGSLVSNSVKVITEDKQGHIWIGTTGGLSMLMPDGHHFKSFKHVDGTPGTISNNYIYDIKARDRESIWIGTEYGLNVMNVSTGHVVDYLPDRRNSFSLNSKSIRSILIDKQGICWLGAYEGGISKYDPNLTFFNLKRSNPYDPYGLSAPFVTAFAEGSNNDVFVGTDGGGLNLFHTKTGLLTHYNIKAKGKKDISELSILALTNARNNALWIGTYQDGLFHLNTSTGQYRQYLKGNSSSELSHNEIFCLLEDRQGKIWIGTNGSGIDIYNPATEKFTTFSPDGAHSRIPYQISHGYIRALEKGHDGKIWIGSYGAGLASFDPVSQSFTLLRKGTGGLPSDKINAIHEDRQGNVWVGTGGEGLVKIDHSSNKMTVYGEKDGLPNGVVHKILEDLDGRIWVSTNKGISWFNTTTKRFTNYSYFNGLQNNSFVQGAGFLTADGTVFFGGVEGVNYINPATLTTNRNVPNILFTDLKVSGRSITPDDSKILHEHISIAKEIYLDYKQNFSISYVALNYTSPRQNQYAYRLKGFDRDWNTAGAKTTANYTNLSPGEYVFTVRASNNDGIWNQKGNAIKIIVKPPFWMTWYAYLFYAMFVISALLLIRRRGIRKLQRAFKLEQEKREAERLRELDQLKIKFLTNLSHEFRTPISLIMAPADKLLAQQPDEQTFSQARVIKRNARRLLNLVNQLLDFRKVEERELKLNLQEGEVISFIKEVSESFQDLSDKKGITFVFNTELNHFYTRFDPDKLERILFNLLSNAFKFTTEGGKVSLVTRTRINHGNSQSNALIIEVSDTGIGIPDEQQARIFERFFQSGRANEILNQGSGIGLSIVKEFVEMHGGNIAISSKVGLGTTFTIELPYLQTDAPQDVVQTVPLVSPDVVMESDLVEELPAAGNTSLPLILIVEDSEDFRFYLKDNLKLNYRIIEASNGKEGWQKALAHHPELIVSDIMMPYMDGIQLSLKIKSDKRTSHIPVVLLTASAGEEEQLKGLTCGANDYLTKPFNFQILNAKINNLLLFNRTLKKAYAKHLKVESGELKIDSANEKFLKSVVEYIEENLNNTQLSVEDLSRSVGMSRGSLYNKLLEITEQSPVEFIRSIKLEKAAILLEKSDMNIAQIGYSVGFATPNYFAKSFKAKYHMLPSEYMSQKRKMVISKE